MAYEFKLPDLGEGLTEGEIAKWLVAEGDEIAEDEPLVEIQTDKTTVEIPSPAAGRIARILVAEGEVAPVGAVLVVIGEDAGEAPPARVQATPLVRKIAQELGVDLASAVASRRRTCAAPRNRSPPRDGARRCGASGGRSSSI